VSVLFTSAQYLSTTSVPAGQTIKSSPVSLSVWANCSTSGSSVLDTGGDIGVYMAIVGSATSGSAFTNWISVGNSSSVGSVFLDISHASTTEEIFVEYGSTSNNTWVHWAATYSGSGTTAGVKIYKNGALVTPVSSGGTITTADAWDRIIVGGSNATLQDAMCFNRVLTASEIAMLAAGRFPPIDMTSVVGWWPLMNGDRTTDISGNGRNLTATGSPVDGTLLPPVSWGGRSPTIIIPASSALALVPQGTTNVTGAVSLTALSAITPAGTTQTTGAVTLGELATVATVGTTQTTGSVALGSAKALTPAGTTNTTGSVSLAELAAIVPAGTTNVTGVVSLTALETLAPSGTTNTTGAVTLAQLADLGAVSGLTSTSGSVTLGSSGSGLPLVPAGTTNTTGSVALTALEAIQTAGSTQTTGAVGIGVSAALAAPSGSTQTTGSVALGTLLQFPAAGTTNVTGSVALTERAALAPTGTTNTTGSVAMGQLVAFPTAGTTTCFGSVVLTGGAPVAPGTPHQSASRRSMSYSGRRHGRV
jgi:fibronectin-binding autotransporter adhesin